jgi:membrane protease YdiL (CAAX protease family)
MQKSKIIGYSFLHALGIAAYIIGVVSLLRLATSFNFGQQNEILVPILMLLMLVFSVGVMAIAVFGRPVYLFVGGFRREALEFLIYTLFWVFVILTLVASIILLAPTPNPADSGIRF